MTTFNYFSYSVSAFTGQDPPTHIPDLLKSSIPSKNVYAYAACKWECVFKCTDYKQCSCQTGLWHWCWIMCFYVLLYAMTTPGLFHCDLPITQNEHSPDLPHICHSIAQATSPVGVAFHCCFQRKSVHVFSLACKIHLHHINYILYILHSRQKCNVQMKNMPNSTVYNQNALHEKIQRF